MTTWIGVGGLESNTFAATGPRRVGVRVVNGVPLERIGGDGLTAKKKPAAEVDLHAAGARVLSVFGPFNSRVLIEMSADAAAGMFPEPFGASGRTNLIEAVEHDLAALRKRDADLADSALAAAAVRLAYEVEDPYNSATSKSLCAKELRETMSRLREMAPPERKKDHIDGIRDDLADRREQARRAAAAD